MSQECDRQSHLIPKKSGSAGNLKKGSCCNISAWLFPPVQIKCRCVRGFCNDEASGSFNFYPGCGSAEWQSHPAHVEVMDYIFHCPSFWSNSTKEHYLYTYFFISELRTHFYLSEAERYCRILLVFTQSCPTLCDPKDCSMSGSSVFHCLPEFAQTHAHWVNDAIQPSHSLLPSSPLALNLSRHQGLFQWVSSSPQVAKLLKLQFQHQPLQWIFKVD